MAANNREFQLFIDRFTADTVSTKVRSLLWECWVAATDAAEALKPSHNKQSTPCQEDLCPECTGSDMSNKCAKCGMWF